jgi:RNA polymerase sigma factor (sigma-70 family)
MLDGEIRRRIVYGDEDALAEVYDSYARLVYVVALRVIRDHSAAEDVTQEVFAHLWDRPLSFDPGRGSLRGWLTMLAHRRAVDRVRTEQRHRNLANNPRLAEPELSGDPAEFVLEAATVEQVRAALAALPDRTREPLELAYLQGQTYRQVALTLGIPEGTAKSRLRLGLRQLAMALGAGA